MSHTTEYVIRELRDALQWLPIDGVVFTAAEVERIAAALGGKQALADVIYARSEAALIKPEGSGGGS